ncbi:MAG: alpha/beta fold hydrolase [Amylibacter sp.]|nr:alpha/beta fold hydrolase [Amylibacter sp.]
MTPLVLVHGFMGGSAQWEPQQSGLSDNIELIAIDLPGFGKNNHLEAINTIGGFADWVISELSNRNVDRYHLLGHSMGGMIAQEIALRDRDRVDHLVLYATGAEGVLPGRFETIEESKTRAIVDGTNATARRIAATWFLHKENAPAYESCAAIAEQSATDAITAGLDAMQTWSGTHNLSDIRPKTLVIWGDNDRTYKWQQIQLIWNSISLVNLAVVPECAHAVHLEKPLIFNRLILDFLNQ